MLTRRLPPCELYDLLSLATLQQFLTRVTGQGPEKGYTWNFMFWYLLEPCQQTHCCFYGPWNSWIRPVHPLLKKSEDQNWLLL